MPLPGGLLQKACYSGQTPTLLLSRLASWVTQAPRGELFTCRGMATGPPGADTHRLQARKQDLGLRGGGCPVDLRASCLPSSCTPNPRCPFPPAHFPDGLERCPMAPKSPAPWWHLADHAQPETASPWVCGLEVCLLQIPILWPDSLSWDNTGWLSLNRPDNARRGTKHLDSDLLPPPRNPGAAQHLAGEFGQ